MELTILPCPHCGKQPTVEAVSCAPVAVVCCSECTDLDRPVHRTGTTLQDAIENWNEAVEEGDL